MIKDLPITDKPREKALQYGINNLTDAELLAIVLRTGVKSLSAIDLSQKIINEVGDISNIDMFTIERLSKIKGIGIAKALTILSAIEIGKRSLKKSLKVKINNSKDIYNNYKYYFFKEKQEIFIILFLDDNKNVTSFKKLYKGSSNSINVRSKEIFKEALLHSSSKIILMHNHPSGSIFPSKEDIATTKNLAKAGELLNIQIIDHLIITDDSYFSFYDNGELI